MVLYSRACHGHGPNRRKVHERPYISQSKTIKVGLSQPCVLILALCTGKDVYRIWLATECVPVSILRNRKRGVSHVDKT
jgi:hypothetical protein